MEAQYLMAPASRKNLARYPQENDNHKKSSVLLLLYPIENKVKILLLLRQSYEGAHSNQISFPGGKVDKDDKDYLHTALRETKEETGIHESNINILGSLTALYIPVSNFLVNPYVGYFNSIDKMDIKIDSREIAAVVDFDIEILLNPKYKDTININLSNGISFGAPCYATKPEVIWGATAMILSEFAELIKGVSQ